MSEQMFKAWDNKNKRWVNQYEFCIFSDGSVHSHADIDGKQKTFDATLCRSTGLKDKLLNTIFEGDIIKSKTPNYEYIREIYFYKNRSCMAMRKLPINSFDSWEPLEQQWLFDYETEIIGNIFENENLLKEKQ